jgi:photosystem II stability/assembly factor-like uncharacterized protein
VIRNDIFRMKNSNRLLLLTLLAFFTLSVTAQKKLKTPAPTEAAERMQNVNLRQALSDNSIANGLEFKSVGPTIMSGRVVDIAVNPDNPTEFFVAYASGGLWHTNNNGTSFESVFDSEMVMTIGALAVNWQNGTIWLGTGEVNSSRSSYAGTGMYISGDFGKTWDHAGLEESHHIGRICLHPTDSKKAWVAVLGHLYTPNPERGVFATSDGGENWSHVLAVNENAGAVDLKLNSDNPDELYAAIWERSRRAWRFTGSGNASAVYQSLDAGQSWSSITGGDSGFPEGANVGRIGLALHSEANSSKLYAILDNQGEREEEEDEKDELLKKDFLTMSKETFKDLNGLDLQNFLEENGFPEKYDTTAVKTMVAEDEITPDALHDYLTDANADLFDKPIIGAEVYSFDPKTTLWTRTHEDYLDDVVFTYGYYFGVIAVDPSNSERVYIAGVPMLTSADGGATWEGINADNVHVDHHSIWINPNKSGHLINGNDGGVNISYDNGETYIKCNNPAVGQFYTVNVDYADDYNVYGGLQDNGVWKGPHDYEASANWHQTGKYPYTSLMGGDGMQVEIDMRDNETVYTGYQFGHYSRISPDGRHYFHPKHELGERPLRWNWQTPIHLSHHNQDILYMGSNKFHRSMDQGETWETLSEDLTYGGIQGDVPYGSLTMIHESPLRFGLIYAGSDDGKIHRSEDAGQTWTDITGKLPARMWVSRVMASQHEEGRVYATLNGYRWDDFSAYLYISEDFGKTWQRLGTDLPHEPLNVVKEDPTDAKLLYVGSDNGLYASLDRGQNFMTLGGDLPPVAIHDLVIQTEANDLVIGTHGRSIYVADISNFMTVNEIEDDLVIFNPEPIHHSSGWGNSGWSEWFGYNEPEREFNIFTQNPGITNLELASDSGLVIKQWSDTVVFKGFNRVNYDLTIDENVMNQLLEEILIDDEEAELEQADNGQYYIPVGNYTLKISMGDLKAETELVVE